MLISKSAEYALRAVVWLAGRPEEHVSTSQISAVTQVPVGYLSKVLQELARAGLVASCPGRAGGFRLVRSPEEITVLDVVRVVDPVQRIESCPLGLESHRGALCPLHRRLDQAAAATEQAFATTTIAEILAESATLAPLCEPESAPRDQRQRR